MRYNATGQNLDDQHDDVQEDNGCEYLEELAIIDEMDDDGMNTTT